MGHHSCCNQQKVKRGLWSPEEDEKLIRYITTHGYGCWSEVPEKAGLCTVHLLILALYFGNETFFDHLLIMILQGFKDVVRVVDCDG